MRKSISAATILIFFMSIYFVPSISAITLGEIKPDSQENESVKNYKDPLQQDKKNSDDKKTDLNSGEKDEFANKKEGRDEVNPRLVCLLSVLMPGGGQFYLNNDVKGIGFCLAAGAGYTATGFFMVKTMLSETGSVAYKNYLLLTGFLFFITLVIHFVGIIEAYSDADEMNKVRLFGNDENNPFVTEFVLK